MSRESNPNKSLFLAALELETTAEREEFLRRECGDDEDRKNEIVSLLAAHDNPPDLVRRVDCETDVATLRSDVGSSIGPYKLREQIGEGGFGVVFVAEQKEPVARKVALKVIKPGMDSKDIIARFEAERQALAMMDHPNVAKVLDAGATESGRPYFVMELVQGVSITEYCDSHKLTNRQRLELFIDVCHAVQHAHQKGIIHRDLKPGNILVTKADHRAIVKVIDFGVAKALHHNLTDKSVYTGFGQLVGTPMYMSPEQAELSSLDVDTRSDIYSLGVLLYELLTGTTPFDKEIFKKAGFDEVRRMIREVEPRRPSDQVSTLKAEQVSTISDARKVDHHALSKGLRGDLDWIVMKTLEKDRTRRYETATALADDVQRFLGSEPVIARPPSFPYRIRKFVHRNKSLAITISTVAVALIMSLLAMAAGTFWAFSGKRVADKRLEQLENTTEALAAVFSDLDPATVSESDQSIESILASRLESVAPRLESEQLGDPLVVARLQQVLGEALGNLGSEDPARDLLKNSYETRRRLLGPEHEETLESMVSLLAFPEVGKLGRTVKFGEQALKLTREHLGPTHEYTIVCMQNLAILYGDSNQKARAIQTLEQVLSSKAANLEDYYAFTARVGLSQLYTDAGEHSKALALLEKACRTRERINGPNHLNTLRARSAYAQALKKADQAEKAIGIYEMLLQNTSHVMPNSHPFVSSIKQDLANALLAEGRVVRARDMYREVLRTQLEIQSPEHPETLETRHNLAASLMQLSEFDEALRLAEKNLALIEEHFNDEFENHETALDCLARWNFRAAKYQDAITLNRRLLDEFTAASINHEFKRTVIELRIATCQRRLGKLQEAESGLTHAYSTLRGRNNSLAMKAGVELLSTLLAAGRTDEAASLKQELMELALSASTREVNPAVSANLLIDLGIALMTQSQYADAEKVFQQCVNQIPRELADEWVTFSVKSRLGEAMASQGKFAEAESLLIEGCQGLIDRIERIPQTKSAQASVYDSHSRLIELYESWNRVEPDDRLREHASEWKQRLEKLKTQE